MSAEHGWPEFEIDARTFQRPLDELATTIALKVEREGHSRIPKPNFVVVDIYVMIRQAQSIYNLFFFLNADERREKDADWRVAYSAAILPLIRSIIDCLYNITVLIANPGAKGYQFRESGFKLLLETVDADERRYGGDPKWDAYIKKRREEIDFLMRVNNFTVDEIRNAKTWPTLSGYLRTKKAIAATPHQEFLKKLTFGFWQEYSGMAHATFQGLMPTACFYTAGDIPYKDRPHFESVVVEKMVSTHIFRVAGILLCILTEVQAHFQFDDANIDERLQDVWDALLPTQEIKELYVERYAQIMKSRGFGPM